MKKFVVILFALMLASVGVVFAQDDENTLDLTVLEEGVIVEDAFGDGVYARLYAFAGTEGDLVSIAMAPAEGSDVDPYLVLLGQSGQVYMTNDDAQSGNPTSLIENFELPDTATYFVLATAWNTRLDQTDAEESNDDLSYQLGIQGNNPPSNLEVSISRGELEIGTGGTIQLDEDEPIFYVIFAGEEGNVVTLTAQSDDIDTLLYLFDMAGNRIAVNDDLESGNLASSIQNFELPEDGNYLVFVTAFNFYDAYLEDVVDTGSVTFTIQ